MANHNRAWICKHGHVHVRMDDTEIVFTCHTTFEDTVTEWLDQLHSQIDGLHQRGSIVSDIPRLAWEEYSKDHQN